jgi:predicted small lipoprotein YifL
MLSVTGGHRAFKTPLGMPPQAAPATDKQRTKPSYDASTNQAETSQQDRARDETMLQNSMISTGEMQPTNMPPIETNMPETRDNSTNVPFRSIKTSLQELVNGAGCCVHDEVVCRL